MNKFHAALLLVAAALAVGWLFMGTAPHDITPASTLPQSLHTSGNPLPQAAPQTKFLPTSQDLPPALVAPDTVRENVSVATPTTNRDLPGASAREPRSGSPGVPDSTLAWPTSLPEPKSSRPPADSDSSLPTSVSLPDPAPVVVDQEIPVPRGEPVPAAIMDEGYGASAEQVQSLDDIAGEFLDNAVSSGPAARAEVQNWRDAARLADERYRTMFGVEAFNRWSMEAAKEALAEKPQR